MKKTSLSRIMKISTLSTILLVVVLLLSSFSTIPAHKSQEDSPINMEYVLEYSYSFSSIIPIQQKDGTILQIEGLDLYTTHTGAPIVPMKTVEIVIPQGQDIESIEVNPGSELFLPMTYDIAPVQEVVPLSYTGSIKLTEKNPEIYKSVEPYPGRFYEVVSLQHSHGFTVLILNLFPLQYTPKSGDVQYYPEMNLKVTCFSDMTTSTSIQGCRMLQSDLNAIQNIDDIENIELLFKYNRTIQPLKPDYSEIKLVDPDDTFNYVIITNEELRDSTGEYTFQDLIKSKIDKGMTATIVTVEDITTCPDYWWNGAFGDGEPLYNDTQCQIRNFIKDAYTNWDTEYILLGGDGDGADVGGESGDEIIPTRELYESLFGDPLLASDLYYACLDGTYDADMDGTYGEPGDGADIDPYNGEVDLLAEVYVGRAPVDSAEELSNFVRKTLAYESSEGDEYLKDVLMVGEHSGFGGLGDWGGNYKDEIKRGSTNYGYTTTGISYLYDVSVLYDRYWQENGWQEPDEGQGGWPKSDILDAINNGIHIINHCGHGNNFKVMKLYEPVQRIDEDVFVEIHDVVDNMTNEQFFFGYSHACYPGAFDNKKAHYWGEGYLEFDSIVEHLVTDQHGAFAFIANTRFGWGLKYSTDGPSQNYDREFFDALFGEEIRNLGWANQDSKEDNIGKLGNAAMRYCYFEITLFGDPELSIKDPPLRDHDIGVTEIDAPDYFWVDTDVVITITLCNRGLSDETDIIVNTFIDETLINSTLISSLSSLDCSQVSTSWSNNTIGRYEIRVEIEPVYGETYVDNNVLTKDIHVCSEEPIKACVLDGFMTDIWPWKYDPICNNWYEYGTIPLDVDCYTLNHDFITYEDLMGSGADILIMDTCMPNDMYQWEFTQDEIDAITRYIEEGHGLLGFYETFGGNNNLLLPLFGLSVHAEGHEQVDSDVLLILDEELLLFDKLQNPCYLVTMNELPADGMWSDNEVSTGIYVAMTPDMTGAIIWNGDNRLYLSMHLGYQEEFINNQLLYNTIVFTSKDIDLYAYTKDSYEGVVGQSIQFYGYASGGEPPYTWHWDFGDSNTSDEQNPSHIYSRSGMFNVTLTVTDDIGNESSASSVATIIQPEPFLVDAHGPYGQLVGLAIQFQGSASGGVPPYQQWHWDFGDGNTSDVQNPVHTYNYVGEYEVNLTVTDFVNDNSYNVTTATARIQVQMNVPNHRPIYEPVEFYGNAVGGFPDYSYHWDFGDGNASDLKNPIYTYHSGGEFIVTLTVTDQLNNVVNDTDNIYITPMTVYVDDDFNESTPGWGWRCFNSIGESIFYVPVNATIFVAEGIYSDYNIDIYESVHLYGQDPVNTIIDGRYLWIQYCENVTIDGFTVQNSPSWGALQISYANNCTITNNIIKNCYHGLILQQVSNNKISGNTFIDISQKGIEFSNNFYNINNTISNNYFFNNNIGVEIIDFLNNAVLTNTFIHCNTGVSITGAQNTTVYLNEFIDNSISIDILGGDHNIIVKNSITGSQTAGIKIGKYSDNNRIIQNIIYSCYKGIFLEFGNKDSTISANTINNCNSTGIFLDSVARYNTIEKNNLDNNFVGVFISKNAFDNKITGNTISNSQTYGMCIHDANIYPNILYRNNFINNAQNAYDDSTNIWYNESLQEGNYWDDFEDNQGYPDYYMIPGGDNIDLYPLTEPYQQLLGDVNDDGKVNIDDLFLVLGAWGYCDGCPEDINGDGKVNIDDLFIILGNWT